MYGAHDYQRQMRTYLNLVVVLSVLILAQATLAGETAKPQDDRAATIQLWEPLKGTVVTAFMGTAASLFFASRDPVFHTQAGQHEFSTGAVATLSAVVKGANVSLVVGVLQALFYDNIGAQLIAAFGGMIIPAIVLLPAPRR